MLECLYVIIRVCALVMHTHIYVGDIFLSPWVEFFVYM